jgi:hypothetical protein
MLRATAGFAVALLEICGSPWIARADEGLVYERNIRPILKAACFHCHGEEEELKGGLDVRLVRLMVDGGESGAALVAGDPQQSLLWQRIEADEMPEGPKKLSAVEKDTIRRWIELGAKTLRPEPDRVEDARYTPEELGFWAFQPPKRVTPPRSEGLPEEAPSHPVDAFIVDRLRAHGLRLSPEADRATLLRRVKIDLHGLPPTADELEHFLADQSPDAYERLIDRLLASPQYGVRWARHWLDVAGYAETDGNPANDQERKHAWRYRDYVVDSLNRDKPFDQFLIEQLAGDELIEGDPDPENERHVELLAATGFLRMAPDVTATDNSVIARNQAVADTVKVISSAVLGLSVGCAQCHDHRYDPISIEDYYRFRAIFDPAFPLDHWKQPEQRLVDMTPASDRAAAEALEAEAVRREADLNRRKREVAQQIFDLHFAAVPEDRRAAVIEAVQTVADQQSEEQKKLLLEFPMVRPIDAIVGQLIEFDKVNNNQNYQRFEAERKEIAAFRLTKPPARLVMCVRDQLDAIPESRVMFRGDPEQRTKPIEPAELFVVARTRNVNPLPQTLEPASKSLGRRLAYARQLTDGSHPLVARVLVNRLWQHHFGVGLVATPNDFGAFGQRPSHPELLDWLACELVDSGWQVKRMHKLLLMAQTYRQQSTRTPPSDAIDSENRWLSRANLRRMDAETIRDALLSVSDDLNMVLGGPSVPIAEDGEGRATIGRRLLNEGLYAGIEDVGSDKYRRSLYLESKRTLPLNLLETFDAPVMNPNCDLRRSSTVAPQALLFLNDQTIIERAEVLAGRLWGSLPDDRARLDRLYQRLFARLPSEEDRKLCAAYLTAQQQQVAAFADPQWQKELAAEPQRAAIRAWASLCQALLASNRFLYID